MYIKNNLNFTILETPNQLEQIGVKLKFSEMQVNLCIIMTSLLTLSRHGRNFFQVVVIIHQY